MKLADLKPRIVRLGVNFRHMPNAMTPEQVYQKKAEYERGYRLRNGHKPRKARNDN